MSQQQRHSTSTKATQFCMPCACFSRPPCLTHLRHVLPLLHLVLAVHVRVRVRAEQHCTDGGGRGQEQHQHDHAVVEEAC